MKKFYENIREKMILTMQRSLPEILKFLGLGYAEFAEKIGVTRQTLYNYMTPNTDENIEREFKRKLTPSDFLAVCAVLDTYLENDMNNFQMVMQILMKNERLKEFEIAIFWRIERYSLRWKWLLNFPTDKFTFPKSYGYVEWVTILENFNMVIDISLLSVMEGNLDFFPLIQALYQTGFQQIVAEKTVHVIENLSNYFFTEESLRLDELPSLGWTVLNAYHALFANNIWVKNKELNDFFMSKRKTYQGAFGSQDIKYSQVASRPHVTILKESNINPITGKKYSEEELGTEMEALVDIIQRLRKTYRALYLTASDEMAEAVMQEIEADDTANLAEFTILKYFKNPGDENGTFTVIDLAGKSKEKVTRKRGKEGE